MDEKDIKNAFKDQKYADYMHKIYKAINIIIEKEVYIYSLMNSRILSHYNNRVYIPYKHQLTQEEFNLLKEVIIYVKEKRKRK